MGYRHYIATIKKEDYEHLKDKDSNSIAAEYNPDEYEEGKPCYMSFNDLPTTKHYCLGEIDLDLHLKLIENGFPFFDKKETRLAFEHYDPYVINREGIVNAINYYKEKILSHYKSLLQDDKKDPKDYFDDEVKATAFEKQLKDAKSMERHWRLHPPINTDLDSKSIASSYYYEYSIFELANILKSLDYENNIVILFAY